MYYDTLTGPRIIFVRNALTAVGKSFPKPVTTALAERDRIATAARDYTPATRDEINAAVAACFLDGRDPAEDEQVRRLITSHSLVTDAGLNVGPQAELHAVAAISAHADEILAMLAGPTEEAGRRLAEAHAVLGEEDDPAVIMTKGVDAVETWTHARRAQDLLRTIDKAWVALAHLTGFASPDADRVLRLCAASLETFERAGRKATPWDIVRAGGEISLADRTSLPARVQRIQEARQRQEGQRAAAVGEGYRRTHGVGAA